MRLAPPGQRGKTSSSAEPGGGSAAPAAGAVVPAAPAAPAAASAAGAAAPRGGGWTVVAARYAPALIAAAAMAVTGLWGLARDSAMGNDEVVSRWAALLSLRQLVHLLRRVDAVHGLYYLLLHGWMAVGTSPAAIRVPSVIAMIVAAALMVVLARRLTGSGWAGLFAGLIMVLTPSITFYAQTARSYALVFACVLGETLVLLHALQAEAGGGTRRQITRRWVAYAALVVLAGYLNEMSLLVLAAHAVTVLLARYGRAALTHWAVASAAAAVVVAPLLALSVKEHGALGWIARPGLRDVWILYHDYFGATIAVPVIVAVCAVVALLPPRGWPRRGADANAAAATTAGTGVEPGAGAGAKPGAEAAWRSGGISLPSVAAPLLVIPAALLFLESLVGLKLYVDRYVLYGEAGAALLAGAGLYRIGGWLADRLAGRPGRRALIWMPAAVVCVCALVLQLGQQQRIRTPASRLYNFGGVANLVGAEAKQGDGVLYFGSFYRKTELGYPADFRKTSDFSLAVPPVVANPFKGIEKPSSAVLPLMLTHPRIWVIGRRPSATLPAGPMRDESEVLLRDFSQITVHGYRGIWVTLWVRR